MCFVRGRGMKGDVSMEGRGGWYVWMEGWNWMDGWMGWIGWMDGWVGLDGWMHWLLCWDGWADMFFSIHCFIFLSAHQRPRDVLSPCGQTLVFISQLRRYVSPICYHCIISVLTVTIGHTRW